MNKWLYELSEDSLDHLVYGHLCSHSQSDTSSEVGFCFTRQKLVECAYDWFYGNGDYIDLFVNHIYNPETVYSKDMINFCLEKKDIYTKIINQSYEETCNLLRNARPGSKEWTYMINEAYYEHSKKFPPVKDPCIL